MTALILDGALPSALSAVRSLGSRGIRTVAAAERSSAMALHSRHAKGRMVYADPFIDPEGFVRDLRDAISRAKDEVVVFVFSDQTLQLVSRHRSELPKNAVFALPESGSVETACDKAATMRLARSLGIAIPLTEEPENAQDVRTTRLAGPYMVKPRHNCVWRAGRAHWCSAKAADTAEEAAVTASDIAERMGEWPLLQERITGEEVGVFMLYENGVAKWTCGHRRLRSLQVGGGASSLRESRRPGDEVSSAAKRLLDALAWHGPAMVEFKRDNRAGGYRLMEINGRFWGSLALCAYAGADFAWATFELARSGRVPEQPPYRDGVRSRYLFNDLRRLAKGDVPRQERSDAPTNLDVESWGDPMPALAQLWDVLWRKRLPI